MFDYLSHPINNYLLQLIKGPLQQYNIYIKRHSLKSSTKFVKTSEPLKSKHFNIWMKISTCLNVSILSGEHV